jgi:hypothetical protein
MLTATSSAPRSPTALLDARRQQSHGLVLAPGDLLLPPSMVSIAAISVRLGGSDGQGDGQAVNGAIAPVVTAGRSSATNPELFPAAVTTAHQERIAAAAVASRPTRTPGVDLMPKGLHAKPDSGGRHYFHAIGLVRLKQEEGDMQREYEGDFVHTLATSVGFGLGLGVAAIVAVRLKRAAAAGKQRGRDWENGDRSDGEWENGEDEWDGEQSAGRGDDEWGEGVKQPSQMAIFGSRRAGMFTPADNLEANQFAERREDVEFDQHRPLTQSSNRDHSVRRRSSGGGAFDSV